MADDLIRRSDAVRVVDDWYQYGSGRAMLIDSIKALPAAAPATPEVPATRVRCFKGGASFWAHASEDDGLWFEYPYGNGFSNRFQASDNTMSHRERNYQEITPASALELLKNWPEGRERFLAYCREHQAIDPPPPPAEDAAGVTVTRELAGKIERLSKALIDMNITLCKYVADDDNLTPLQCEALRAAYMDEQVNASMVFHDLAEARQKAGG